MADNELLIKISADAKNVQKAFDDVRTKTADLEDQLGTIAKISAVGFAALTAEVGFSVKAFVEAESATNALTQALINQGIYTEELAGTYKNYAVEVQNATGIDDDAITSAQAVAQSYLGQTEITLELTQAIADLAAAKRIDLNSAAIIVSKSIGTSTNALSREGLELDKNLSASQRYAAVLDFLKGRYDGQAAAANKSELGLKALQTAFGNLQEGIGARFAPVVEYAANVLKNLFNTISNSPQLQNFVVAATAAGLVVTGLGVAIPALAGGFLVLKAALISAGVAAGSVSIAIAAATGAIGLLVFAGVELALNWDAVWARITQVVAASIVAMTTAMNGFKEVLAGVFTFDVARINSGMEQVKAAFEKGFDDALKELPPKAQATEDELANIRKNAIAQRQADLLEEKEWEELERADALTRNMDFEQKRTSDIQASLLTEKEARLKVNNDIMQEQVAANNKRLTEQMRYGAAYAAINAAINSAEVQGFKQGTDNLVALQNSKNATLKSIGKAAAVSSIAINTAQAAMNIFTGFSKIPFIGYALGVAGAAAAIAYGAEQIGNVTAAADGGILTGGTPGRDSIPVLGMPGELVVPTKNYEEVVTSVADRRNAEGASMGGFAQVEIILNDNLMDFIETRLVERRNLSISLQGAV